MNSIENNIRLPAEWEPQDGVLLAWPDAQTDWQPILPQIHRVYQSLIRHISAHEKVILICRDAEAVSQQLLEQALDLSRIIFVQAAHNDTWCRDFGPITIFSNNRPILLDYQFNGWGGKFAAELDNLTSSALQESGVFGDTPRQKHDLFLEGGSIESDGEGTILTTSACLLNDNRNRQLSKSQLETCLKNQLGARQILWLDYGFLTGDDTDSHIDTLARLCPKNTILYVQCGDPADEHYAELLKMQQQLGKFKTLSGETFRLLPLPWPNPIHTTDGERLPATYANYLVINSAVLVPTYADPADEMALKVIQQAYPDREIIPVDCRAVIEQNGSLHCLTMQIPQGVLA